MSTKRTVGLDIGYGGVRIVELQLAGRSAVPVRRVEIPRDDLVRDGVDPDDPSDLAPVIARAMHGAGIKGGRVVLGLNAAEGILRYTHMPPLPPNRLATVMTYEIDVMAERMEEKLASDFTALQFHREDGERTILLGLAKDARLRHWLEAFDGAGVRIGRAVPGPLAVFAAWELYAKKVAPDAEGDDLVVALDLGRDNLHLALILNGRLVFARSAQVGGQQFTDALAQGLGLRAADAERLKIERGGLKESGKVRLETVAPLRTAAARLVSVVQSSIQFCRTQTGVSLPAVTRVWATGGGMRLRGLPEHLGSAFGGATVEFVEPGITKGGDSGSTSGFAIAIGLSATEITASSGPTLNVLPADYRAKRRFRDRTLYLWIAASMLLVFLLARLGHGLLVQWDAEAKRQALSAQRVDLEAQRSQRDRSMARSEEIRSRINFLLREAEPTSLQSFVLQALGDHLRPEIQIDSVALVSEESEDGREFRHSLQVRGRVSEERNKGNEWLEDLQELLAREERIADVVIRSASPEGQWVVFELVLHPNTRRI